MKDIAEIIDYEFFVTFVFSFVTLVVKEKVLREVKSGWNPYQVVF